MIVYVLDSSAVLRYLDHEAGAERVNAILRACAAGPEEARISAVQWGEVAGRLRKKLGAGNETHVLANLLPDESNIIAASGDRAVRAAALKVDKGIAYADAFALELTMDSPDRVLVTADYGFKSVADLATIEFLPAK